MTEDPGDLRAKIEAAKAARAAKQPKARPEAGDASQAGALALRYGAEFGASVFVGILFGLGIDRFFGTRPWGLLVMLGFGLAAGVVNVVRAYRQLTAAATGDTPRSQSDQDRPDSP